MQEIPQIEKALVREFMRADPPDANAPPPDNNWLSLIQHQVLPLGYSIGAIRRLWRHSLVWCFVDDEKRKPAVRKTAKCHVDSRLFVLRAFSYREIGPSFFTVASDSDYRLRLGMAETENRY